jgi:inorganic pyrophosphatase
VAQKRVCDGRAQVKVLGVLGLIDDKETDWKLIVISIADPLAEHLVRRARH